MEGPGFKNYRKIPKISPSIYKPLNPVTQKTKQKQQIYVRL